MMQVPAQYAIFPAINATLNGASAVLLLIGRGFIKRGRRAAHRAVMITALVSSTLFLISYLYYHAHVGSVHFQGQGLRVRDPGCCAKTFPDFFAVLDRVWQESHARP